jgi:hypothetical protein
VAGVQGAEASCYQAASPALARLLRDDIVATYGAALPSPLACLRTTDRRLVKGNFNFSVYIPTYNYTIQCERKLPGSPRSYVS